MNEQPRSYCKLWLSCARWATPFFTFGALGLGWFVLGLKTGWSLKDRKTGEAEVKVPFIEPAR